MADVQKFLSGPRCDGQISQLHATHREPSIPWIAGNRWPSDWWTFDRHFSLLMMGMENKNFSVEKQCIWRQQTLASARIFACSSGTESVAAHWFGRSRAVAILVLGSGSNHCLPSVLNGPLFASVDCGNSWHTSARWNFSQSSKLADTTIDFVFGKQLFLLFGTDFVYYEPFSKPKSDEKFSFLPSQLQLRMVHLLQYDNHHTRKKAAHLRTDYKVCQANVFCFPTSHSQCAHSQCICTNGLFACSSLWSNALLLQVARIASRSLNRCYTSNSCLVAFFSTHV